MKKLVVLLVGCLLIATNAFCYETFVAKTSDYRVGDKFEDEDGTDTTVCIRVIKGIDVHWFIGIPAKSFNDKVDTDVIFDSYLGDEDTDLRIMSSCSISKVKNGNPFTAGVHSILKVKKDKTLIMFGKGVIKNDTFYVEAEIN